MDPFYIILAFISIFILSLSLVYSKFVLVEFGNPIHMLLLQVLINFIAAIGIYLVLLFTDINLNENLNLENTLRIFLSSFFIFLALITLYVGLHKGNASVGGVILSSRVILSVLFALIFLNTEENFPFTSYLWIIIVIIGVVLSTWEKDLSYKDLINGRKTGAIYFIFAIVFMALANTIIRLLDNEVFVATHILIRLFFLSIFVIAFYPFLNRVLGENKSLYDNLSTGKIKSVTFYTILIVIGDFGFTSALSNSLTISETIGALEGVFAFIIILTLSLNKKYKSILNETLDKKTLLSKILGIIIAVVGIILFISDIY